jgi:hypothetical protein
MFKSLVILLTSVLFFFVIMTSYGFDKSTLNNTETKNAAIKNLLIGLQSDNFGLRTSSAFMLGEIKAEEAVIPLMKMLRTEKNEDARIMAALSLFKIDNPKGIFAVKQATRFDDSERVRRMCTNFYIETLKMNNSVEDTTYNSEVAFR